MSLRDRLEGKARRRLSVPVQISDPTEDFRDLNGAAVALEAARTRSAPEEELAPLRALVEELSEKVKQHWAPLELQALHAAEWEIAASNWQKIEVNEDGPVSVMDWTAALPPLLAESCVDPDLKDAEWWAEQLAKPHWTEGDLDALRAAILQLNIDAAGAQAPKE